MKKIRTKCLHCSLRGYSPDFCKFHHENVPPGLDDDENECLLFWSKKAAIGAGAGIAGMVAGMAVLPAFGMKAILGHFVAAKMTGVGGIVGAGTNVAANLKKQQKKKTKKRSVILPRQLGG